MHQNDEWNAWEDNGTSESPTGQATCRHGIIHTNSRDKGPILRRFLEQHALRASSPSPLGLVVMVDNLVDNCQSVHNALQASQAAHAFRLAACHYVVPGARPPLADMSDQGEDTNHVANAALDRALLQRHLEFFLAHGHLVADADLPLPPPPTPLEIEAACHSLLLLLVHSQ
jgi:hypothetical protein